MCSERADITSNFIYIVKIYTCSNVTQNHWHVPEMANGAEVKKFATLQDVRVVM